MKKQASLGEQFRPWAGLVVGVVSAGIAHQFGSDSVFDACASASPVAVLVAAAAGIIATLAAALFSWRVVRNSAEPPARRLVAIISAGTAALLVLATLLPMLASLVLPPCFQ